MDSDKTLDAQQRQKDAPPRSHLNQGSVTQPTRQAEPAKSEKDKKKLEPHGPIASTATILGHPIHPMVIPFPIAFLTGAIVTDVLHTITEENAWAEASFWLILSGLVTGAVAAAIGFIDFSNERVRAHSIAWLHMGVNALALGLALINLLIRPMQDVPLLGLMLSVAVGAVLTVGGWFGGELAYRHQVGVNPITHEDVEDDTPQPKPLDDNE